MKIRWGVSVLALLLLLSGSAFAAVQSFPRFTIDVPADWTASEVGPTVNLIANDRSAAISITVASTEGVKLEELAKAFSQKFEGTAPTPGNGGYQFSFGKGSAKSNALIVEDTDTKEYVLIVITGENPKVEAILDSLEDK